MLNIKLVPKVYLATISHEFRCYTGIVMPFQDTVHWDRSLSKGRIDLIFLSHANML